MKTKLTTLAALLAFFGLNPAQALIIFNGDNLATASDPSDSTPWDATARMANYDGSSVTAVGETAIHLGNGYMLTTDHSGNRSHVSFDGSTWLSVDSSFTPQQVAPGVDLKIFKLTSTPTTSQVVLHDNSGGELNTSGTMVGWGRGREDASQTGDNIQDFGKDGTIDKRWGTNTIKEVASESWTIGSTTYTQDAMTAVLGNTEGDNEFAFAIHDSGSPFFQEINGTIVLSGIAATRTAQNGTTGDFKATFGDDRVGGLPFGRGDENLFVRVGEYADEIAAIVPESGHFGIFSGWFALMTIFGFRRVRTEA